MPAGEGRFKADSTIITLPDILGWDEVCAAVSGVRVDSPAAVQLLLGLLWEYATKLDEEGFFAAPVSLLSLDVANCVR